MYYLFPYIHTYINSFVRFHARLSSEGRTGRQ